MGLGQDLGPELDRGGGDDDDRGNGYGDRGNGYCGDDGDRDNSYCGDDCVRDIHDTLLFHNPYLRSGLGYQYNIGILMCDDRHIHDRSNHYVVDKYCLLNAVVAFYMLKSLFLL